MSGPYWKKAWNPIRGCTPVSPGCDHCWARRRLKSRNGSDPSEWPEDLRIRELAWEQAHGG